MFFRVNFCFDFKYISGHIREWIMVWGCMQWRPVLLANEGKKESESSTKNHNVVILSGFDVLNFVIIVNVFGDCFGCLWWKKKCFHIIWFLFYFLMSLIQHFFYYIYFYMDDQFVIFRDFFGFCMLDYLLTILIEHLFRCWGKIKWSKSKWKHNQLWRFFLDTFVNYEFCFVNLPIVDYFVGFGRYFF